MVISIQFINAAPAEGDSQLQSIAERLSEVAGLDPTNSVKPLVSCLSGQSADNGSSDGKGNSGGLVDCVSGAANGVSGTVGDVTNSLSSDVLNDVQNVLNENGRSDLLQTANKCLDELLSGGNAEKVEGGLL